MQHNVLQMEQVSISFSTERGELQAVSDLSFRVAPGEIVAVVGESGCGKSVSMLSIIGLLPPQAKIKGNIILDGQEMLTLHEQELRKVRGSSASIVFQDPMTALNPVLTIGKQLLEAITVHRRGTGRDEAHKKAQRLLQDVGIGRPDEIMLNYPHQLSGGMRQRVLIAMALAQQPKLLIADEPTTALDATIQAQILELLKDINRRTHMSIVLITHDLGIVAGLCQRVLVMYAGRVVESGAVDDIFYRSTHPYTKGLLQSVPRLGGQQQKLQSIAGHPPDLLHMPKGCTFHPRCQYAMQICTCQQPPSLTVGAGHAASCWLQHEMAGGGFK